MSTSEPTEKNHLSVISRDDNGADDDASGPGVPRGSQANAVTHGLTSTTVLPHAGRVAALARQLLDEHPTGSLVELTMQREIARHTAMLELAEQAEAVLLQHGTANFAGIIAVNDLDADEDLSLATAVTSDALERLTRYRRAHEKALHQAIQKLLEFRRRSPVTPRAGEVAPSMFATERDCMVYLRARFTRADWRCPACSSHHGCWLESREVWECRACSKQVGPRHGTVMAGSPLPLTTWFAAIRYVTADMSMTATKLQRLISVRRPATAQSMLRRIRDGIKHNDPLTQLAGLSQYPLFEAQ
jgi:hypothetical protein